MGSSRDDSRDATIEAVEAMSKVVADSGGDPERPRTRRQLLTLAGTAIAGGAALTIANATPAAAADGDPILIGNFNDGTFMTYLSTDVDGWASFGTGNFGADPGPDIKADGTGRLAQVPGASGVAQPAHQIVTGYNDSGNAAHEIVRSDTGIIWASTTTGVGSDTAWKRVNAVRVDHPNGTGAAFAPFRLVNTIDGTGGATGKRAVNTNTVYNAAAHASLPDDTVAIFGNLSVVGSTYNNGYIKLFPTGVAVPGTSSINFNANQTVANFFFLGLGTGANAGKFTVRPGSSTGGSGSVHVIVDVTAYVQ